MNSNRSIGLAIVAVVVLLSGLLVAHLRSGGSSTDDQKDLYPALKKEADSINTVRIFKAGDTANSFRIVVIAFHRHLEEHHR